MMNCPPDPSQHLIPVQGFGFFSPCALEKIQTRFQVYFYSNKMDTANGFIRSKEVSNNAFIWTILSSFPS